MTHNNNLPPFEEQKQLINEEQLTIQEILSKFQQPIPSNFTKLERLKWMCSTPGWKEPGCERYCCLINGEWKQVDIRSTLLERLELEKNIPYPVYISPKVSDKGLDNYFAYNVESEEEIFLVQPFTINDLPAILQRWKTEIEQLKSERDDYRNKWDNSMEELEQKGEIIKSYLRKIGELEEEKKKTIEDFKRQLVEINKKDLKIKEFEEEIKKTQQEVKEAQEKLKEKEKAREITLQMYESELKKRVGTRGLKQLREKAERELKEEV